MKSPHRTEIRVRLVDVGKQYDPPLARRLARLLKYALRVCQLKCDYEPLERGPDRQADAS